MTRTPLTVAVVGATGAVGRTMIQVLLERRFPIETLRLLASARSAGKTLEVGGRTVTVEEATPEVFAGIDIALFSAGKTTSLEVAPKVAAAGAIVVDNSSAWRMDPQVPLVVPEVNAISAGPVRTLAAAGIAGFKKMYGTFAELAPLRSSITIDVAPALCTDSPTPKI